MKLKSFLAKPYAAVVHKRISKSALSAVADQNRILNQLIKTGTKTKFGKDHHFASVKSYEDFKKQVPIRDYEGLKPYIQLIKEGKENILWKGKPLYFAKTSGTT